MKPTPPPASDTRLAGICGIYCGDCPAYLAPRLGDQAEVAKLAARNDLAPDQVGCDGCLSSRLMPACRSCGHGFRSCAADHGVTWCFECAEFPCPRLEGFREVHVREGVSHHRGVIEALKAMAGQGVDAWVQDRAALGACPGCGRPLYWFQRQCPACGQVRRLDQPVNPTAR